MSEKQRKAVYDPEFRSSFAYGGEGMNEKQRKGQFKGQFSGDGEDMTEKQRKALNDLKLAKPIPGIHANDREQMGFSNKKKNKACYICQYTMFMVPKFRDEADAQYKIYHQTNPPRNNKDGTENKDYVSPAKYALRATYSNEQRMLKNSTGGCNKCNIWVCDTCWPNFDHDQAQKYVQFKLTRPNFSDFGKQMYYVGHCETCGDDMYTGIQYDKYNMITKAKDVKRVWGRLTADHL